MLLNFNYHGKFPCFLHALQCLQVYWKKTERAQYLKMSLDKPVSISTNLQTETDVLYQFLMKSLYKLSVDLISFHNFELLSIHIYLTKFITDRQRRSRKVMFPVMSVCSRGFPCSHYPWCIGPPGTDILWPSLETCSNVFTWRLIPHWLPPKHVLLARGQ